MLKNEVVDKILKSILFIGGGTLSFIGIAAIIISIIKPGMIDRLFIIGVMYKSLFFFILLFFGWVLAKKRSWHLALNTLKYRQYLISDNSPIIRSVCCDKEFIMVPNRIIRNLFKVTLLIFVITLSFVGEYAIMFAFFLPSLLDSGAIINAVHKLLFFFSLTDFVFILIKKVFNIWN